MQTKVFVYGTLREGGVNHYLLKEAKYLGHCSTRPFFKMFHLGTYPGVIKGGFSAIEGEVYAVDTRLMKELDKLEGYPKAYTRAFIDTPWGKAWIYLYRGNLSGRALIPSGIWRDVIYHRRWRR
jgi:gamma-glutamylcyclotransferase (GGCT)/AIG2-like uncharacterized protein YtfP